MVDKSGNNSGKYKNGGRKTFIIQKYMEKPLLYCKRKFDIRCYVLVNIQNKQMKGYWYSEGYIRTSGVAYSLNSLGNKQVHLTNDAVQKKGEDYGKFEMSNKISYQDFQKYLDTENIQTEGKRLNFEKHLHPQMKHIAKLTLHSVYNKIDPQRINNTFELFGLDYMIDHLFHVYLIEVNNNPDINTCCPLLSKIIPAMLDNLFRIAVDPVFPPPNIYNCHYKKP